MSRASKPGDRYWRLIEPFWTTLNNAWNRGDGEFVTEVRRFPPRVVHLYAAHWCQSEVKNGGFHQFFYNTTGLLAPEAAEAFSAIGMSEWAALLAEAMGYFEGSYPRERSARLARLPQPNGRTRAEWDPFDELDEKFYRGSDGKRLRWELAADSYASAHLTIVGADREE